MLARSPRGRERVEPLVRNPRRLHLGEHAANVGVARPLGARVDGRAAHSRIFTWLGSQRL